MRGGGRGLTQQVKARVSRRGVVWGWLGLTTSASAGEAVNSPLWRHNDPLEWTPAQPGALGTSDPCASGEPGGLAAWALAGMDGKPWANTLLLRASHSLAVHREFTM